MMRVMVMMKKGSASGKVMGSQRLNKRSCLLSNKQTIGLCRQEVATRPDKTRTSNWK